MITEKSILDEIIYRVQHPVIFFPAVLGIGLLLKAFMINSETFALFGGVFICLAFIGERLVLINEKLSELTPRFRMGLPASQIEAYLGN